MTAGAFVAALSFLSMRATDNERMEFYVGKVNVRIEEKERELKELQSRVAVPDDEKNTQERQ
jgi:hypothetical protein